MGLMIVLASNVVPLESAGRWETIEVRVSPPRPQIAPGTYWARSVSLRKYTAFNRTILELQFDVYKAAPEDSPVLARVPMFVRLPKSGDRLSANCRLASMLRMLGLVRSDRVQAQNLDVLRGKLWRVEVADTKQDQGGPLKDTDLKPYSVVRRPIGRG